MEREAEDAVEERTPMSATSVVRLAVVALLMTSALLPAGFYALSPSPALAAQGAWWDPSFSFRRTLTVTNPGSTTLANQPILVRLNFSAAEVTDAVAQTRLVDASTGSEVPSYVIDQKYTGGSVTTATVVFLANLKPSASASYFLYFGNPSAVMPGYRGASPVSAVTNGLVTFRAAPSRPYSDLFSLSYGGTFTESFLSRVYPVGSPGGGFGSAEISTKPYGNDTGWRLVGNDTARSAAVLADSLDAGAVRVTKVLVLFEGSATGLLALSPTGSSPAAGVSYAMVINSTSLTALGQASSQYSTADGLFTSAVASTLLGFLPSALPSQFDVGKVGTVASEASTGAFLSRTAAAGATGAAMAWNLHAGMSGGASLSFGWTAGSGLLQVKASLASVPSPVSYQLGEEEVGSGYSPDAILTSRGSVSIKNASVTQRGLAVPLTVAGGALLPGSASFSGTFHYVVPGPTFSGTPGGWTATRSALGNSSSVASLSFYSLDNRSNVGRLAAYSNSLGSPSSAGFESKAYTVMGSPDPILSISYKAYFSALLGVPANQTFYAAVDLDGAFSGTTSKTLFLPVAGSSTSINPFSCGPASIPAPRPNNDTAVVRAGTLVADGTWRTVTLDLGRWGDSTGFQARIRFCEATIPAFAGSMEMQISSASVRVTGDARSIYAGAIAYAAPVLSVAPPAAGSYSSPTVTMSGTVSFLFAQDMNPSNTNGTSFGGSFFRPLLAANASKSLGVNATVTQAPVSLSVLTQFAPRLSSFSIDQRPAAVSIGNGMILAGSVPLPAASGSKAGLTTFAFAFRGYVLTVDVVGADGSPVSGSVLVFATSLGTIGSGIPVSTASTSSSGEATAELLPWGYQVTASYDGTLVGTSIVVLNGTSTTTLHATVNTMRIKVTDSLHGALAGAQVTLTLGSSTIEGTTDSQGVFSFMASADKDYSLSVSEGGAQMYTGTIRSAPNGATVNVSTSYLPGWVYLTVLSVLAVIAVASVGTAYLLRWRRARPKVTK